MSEYRNRDKEGSVNPKRKFFSGVAILTLSTVVVKVIGLLYKIPMMKVLGEEGMGYFNSAYEIYTFFYILATAGLPVAVSILISENLENKRFSRVKRIFRVSMTLFLLLGLAGTAVLYFGSTAFAEMIENSGAAECISAISPMVLFICVSSSIRGYFQGCQNMVPTAVSQMIEAAGKLFLGLAFATWATGQGVGVCRVSAFATIGMTLGAGASMLFLIISKCFDKRYNINNVGYLSEKKGRVAASIIKIALPITLSSAVISFTRVTDLFMILRRLQSIGYTEAAANAIYGSYTTLAISMFNLPASFVTPIALAIVPVLTAAVGSGDKARESATLNSSLRLCGLITLPASLGLSVFSRPILEFVFRGEEGAINTAAPLLSVLGMSVFFSCMMTVTNAILQAYGKERLPMVSMVVGAAVKIVVSYLLIGIPSINVYGAAISTFVCSLTVAAMNFFYIKKCATGLETPVRLFGNSLGASVLAVAVGGGAYFLLLPRIGASPMLTLLSIGMTVLLFAVSALKLGAINENDLLLLPGGGKIYKILKKTKLV